MILHLKPCLMWCMLFVGNINLTNMTELGDLTLVAIIIKVSLEFLKDDAQTLGLVSTWT